jgi:hypothetical protein
LQKYLLFLDPLMVFSLHKKEEQKTGAVEDSRMCENRAMKQEQ